ncbi:protein O-GlcNAcase [Brevibacillus ginsengisoli]|uniref:protein O-GlcNAcase n=1 Tax=Brevibacillus ginsengisoli TaxID=363854 RepID=UPI003CEA0645
MNQHQGLNESPVFRLRGVIEGFYGKPWTMEERLEMMTFIHRHGYNTYFYAPKDDPYLRDRWQEDHPTRQFELLQQLIRHATQLGLDFTYCISPGLSMKYSSEEHFNKLLHKYRRVFDEGVRQFSILYDDIPSTLLHAEDRQSFQDLADAHVQVTLALWKHLQDWSEETRLIVCPTQYFGMGGEPYIQYLGQNLPPEIPIFWTGRFICSPFLTEHDAQRFEAYTGHPPLYWDNYPVNDLLMADELHIGPLLHRDPHLNRHACGYVANAMELSESSKIPLITIADYLRDPEHYDPEESWSRAIREVVGASDAEAFQRFADNVRGSFLNDQESPQLLEAFHEFRFRYLHHDQEAAVSRLMRTFREMEQTASYLLHRMSNKKLASEVKSWLNKYWHWAKVGQAAVSLIDQGRKGKLIRAAYQLVRLKLWLKRTEKIPRKVCGNVVKLFTDIVLQEVQKQRG